MLLSLALPLLASTPLQEDRVEAWGEDLLHLIEQFEAMHPDPFHGVARETFEEAVSALYERLPDLDDDALVVELMRLFALHSRSGKEGHCGVYPGFTDPVLPLQLYRFEDGWFVVDAFGEEAGLVGARVVGIEGRPIAEVVESVAPLVTHDNDTNLLGKLPGFLVRPRLLRGLGLGGEQDSCELELVLPGGERAKRRLAAGAPRRVEAGPPADADVLWLSNPQAAWWMRVLDERSALYVQFNATQAQAPDGQSLESFAAEVAAAFDHHDLERVVLDVRLNGGGNNTTFTPLVEALRGHARINRPGALFALIGRGTFSAAGNFVTVLERDTNVILVGEPTGGGPNQFGDARTVQLPHHDDLVVLRISTRYHEFDPEHPDRLTHEPHLFVPLTSQEYFAGTDPVLERALSHVAR